MKPWTLLETKAGCVARRTHPDYGLRKIRFDNGKPAWQIQFKLLDSRGVRRRLSWHLPRVPVKIARHMRDCLLNRIECGAVTSYDAWKNLTGSARKYMLLNGWAIEIKGRLALPYSPRLPAEASAKAGLVS